MSARARAAATLERWSAPSGPLHFAGPNNSRRLFAHDPLRDLVLERILDEYLDLHDDVGSEGRCAVVTAGPPGAGKSTLVDGLGYGFRIIDPDIIKDLLLAQALSDGTYDRLLAHDLDDGEPLHPRELSGLVHAESTVVAKDVMRVAMGRGENVVVEGTLQWEPIVDQLLDAFEEHRYVELTILSCDVPEAIAQERALDRWWRDRCSFADGLGGRFVPSRVITDLYPKTVDSSRCRENADAMFAQARGRFAEISLKTTDLNGTDIKRHTVSRPRP